MLLSRIWAMPHLTNDEQGGGYSRDAQDDEDQQDTLQTDPLIPSPGLFMLRLVRVHMQGVLSSAECIPTDEDDLPVHLLLPFSTCIGRWSQFSLLRE
jgi:hypothetical protein